MTLIQLQSKKIQTNNDLPILSEGFRLFFLGGMIFSAIIISIWLFVYAFDYQLKLENISSFQWHAHEMVYGYAMAIIVGFLLTAVRNWLSINTLSGYPLGFLFLIWLLARVCFTFGFIKLAFVFDISFLTYAVVSIVRPIVKARSWKQLGVVSKLIFFIIGNSVFYLGMFNVISNGITYGVYGGFYLVISLILTIGSRVMPGFISSGVNYDVAIKVPKWIEYSSLVFFIVFFINELFVLNGLTQVLVCTLLFFINVYRLYCWHTRGIWQKPLLWGLYLAFIFITLGFLLFALGNYLEVSKYIAIHSMAYGGIGFATISMISRVALGHTGRTVHMPPRGVIIAIFILLIGYVCRVLVPIIFKEQYLYCIIASQILWIASFCLLKITLYKILISSNKTLIY